jgi:hypothetical protein
MFCYIFYPHWKTPDTPCLYQIFQNLACSFYFFGVILKQRLLREAHCQSVLSIASMNINNLVLWAIRELILNHHSILTIQPMSFLFELESSRAIISLQMVFSSHHLCVWYAIWYFKSNSQKCLIWMIVRDAQYKIYIWPEPHVRAFQCKKPHEIWCRQYEVVHRMHGKVHHEINYQFYALHTKLTISTSNIISFS